jgi:hypothetical protein
MRNFMRKTQCLMLVLLASGCAAQDPFERPQTWSPTRANDANLRVMVANPNDLSAGVEEPGSLSAETSPAIKRLLAGRRRALPVTNASNIGSVGAAPAEQAAGPDSDQSR